MKEELTVHLNITLSVPQLDLLSSLVRQYLSQGDATMATLQQVQDDVAAQGTLIGSLSTLTSGIKAQLDQVLAGALPPDKQAQVDKIFSDLEAQKAALAQAITANTPVAAPPITQTAGQVEAPSGQS